MTNDTRNGNQIIRENCPVTEERTRDYSVVKVEDVDVLDASLNPDYVGTEGDSREVASGIVAFHVRLASGHVLLSGGYFRILDGDPSDMDMHEVEAADSQGDRTLLVKGGWEGSEWVKGDADDAPRPFAVEDEALGHDSVKAEIWRWFGEQGER